jgi:type III pantothenate kinase
MEINLLVVDVGNTNIALGCFLAGALETVSRVPANQPDGWPAAIGKAWSRLDARQNPAVAGASVNPAVADALEEAVLKTTNRTVQWVGEELDLPIRVTTERPDQTGVDRVLAIAAAHEQMGKACVVVDAGSAITIDCCSDRGDFLGGAIAPGAAMMLDALHERTAQLPRVEMARPAEGFGRSTEEAIRQGVYHGIRGMVKELVENYATALGAWPEIIATGGDAKMLFEGWELIHAISPDLVLYGIALAYAEHHIKHGT